MSRARSHRPRRSSGVGTENATTQLTQIECNRRGWDLCVVSKTGHYPLPGGGFRTLSFDLLGLADGLAFPRREGGGVIFLQWTSADHVADHIAKAEATPELALLRRARVPFLIWGWSIRGSFSRCREVWMITPPGLACRPGGCPYLQS